MAVEIVLWPVLDGIEQEHALDRAAAALRRGELVVIPTETVYGLAANALDPNAVGKIYAAKGRPAANPLIVHVASAAQAKTLAAEWPLAAQQLAERFWPGPLTLVLPKRPNVPDAVTAGGATVALRCPQTECTRRLIERAGTPLAAPSANRSNFLSPTQASHLEPELVSQAALVLDAGPCVGGIESTVVDLAAQPPRLLRPGPISKERLETILGPIELGPPPAAAGPLRSPGQLARHYAPRTPLFVFESARALRKTLDALQPQGLRLGVVGFGQAQQMSSAGRIRFHPAITKLEWMLDDPVGYAARLYFVLHELDRRGLDRILLLLPPDEPQWLAVRDRLLRAGTLADRGGQERP